MRSRTLSLIAVMTFLAAMATVLRLAAQVVEEHYPKHHRYKLIETGTFGGPNSYFTFINRPLNNHGVATGFADTPVAVNPPFCFIDCYVADAFRWQNGVLTDLGALPGGVGSGPSDINAKGVVAGVSLNRIDPVTGFPEFTAVVWNDGQIMSLGTFGGTFSYASAINDHAQVVGFALNSTPDSFDLGDSCQNFPMPTQMRAFIWHRGVIRDLGTLGGTDSCALFINERGQAAGNSFTNSIVNPGTQLPTLHPFFWDGDEMRDLGALGNGTEATASGMNNRGQVAGRSNLADDFTFHAFLWDQGKLTDFGTLGGDFLEVIGLNEAGEFVGQAQLPNSQTVHAFLGKNGVLTDLGTPQGNPCSVAISINIKGQIVGSSDDCSGNNGRAFLWTHGHMTDLNAFVPAGSSLRLTTATLINDRGEIAAEGMLPDGDQRAVLLIPCDENHDDSECEDDGEGTAVLRGETSQEPTFVIPENGKLLLQRRGFGRSVRSPQNVALSDTTGVSRPNASLSPTSLTFPTQVIGTTSAAKTVTLKNTGNANLTISSIAITGTNLGDFAQTHTCGSSLAGGASCSISVEFKPTASGTRSAALSITDNAPGSPQKVALTGTGVAPTCIPFGEECFGPARPHCCRAPFPHHSFCSNPTGWGTCIES
jgi:probable HAF family extracellular repeat protein